MPTLPNWKAIAAIKTLLLYKTQVSDPGLERLAKLPALEFVNVGESRVTELGVSALKAARPGITIDR
jgi:hypothetical protein